MITRKRAALAREEARVRALCDLWLAEWDPLRRASVPRLRRLAHLFHKAGDSTRNYRTARSRFLYGCRTGGRW